MAMISADDDEQSTDCGAVPKPRHGTHHTKPPHHIFSIGPFNLIE